MKRTAKARLEAIMPAIARRDAFLARVSEADNIVMLYRMMLEAIDLHLEANGLDPVGQDGRAIVSMEEICASHCLKAIRDRHHAING